MTSQIIPSMFTGSFELIVTDNKKNTGTSYHDTERKARETEIYIYQQAIIADLRDILKKSESLDKKETITFKIFSKGPDGDQLTTAIFISHLQDFLKETKEYGAKALNYQLAYYCRPILLQALPRIPQLKTIIQDIAVLLAKSTAVYGDYQVNNPEPGKEQASEMRTLNTMSPRERFLAGHHFKVYGSPVYSLDPSHKTLFYESNTKTCWLAIEVIEDEYFGYHSPSRRGPAVLYVKFSGLKF